MKKLNMVIGAFFNNVGVQLLKVLSPTPTTPTSSGT